jgi:hypothetical protein
MALTEERSQHDSEALLDTLAAIRIIGATNAGRSVPSHLYHMAFYASWRTRLYQHFHCLWTVLKNKPVDAICSRRIKRRAGISGSDL